MGGIPVTRCQFLIPIADIHTEVGASAAPLLAKFHLPTSLEEKADHFVPILQAIRFAEAAQRSQGIADIAFQAARRLQYCHLSERLRTIVGHSPTLFTALQRICKWAPLENTILSIWLEHCDDHLKICNGLAGTSGLWPLEHSHWFNNIFLIHIVRQFAGPDWVPATMAFESRYTPSLMTQSCWPNTRFMSGQHASCLDVPVEYLSLPILVSEIPADPFDDEAGPSNAEMVGTLKLMLPSYLDEGTPGIAEVAEMAGVSVRSFQRKLSYAGLTYSDLLETVRFEN